MKAFWFEYMLRVNYFSIQISLKTNASIFFLKTSTQTHNHTKQKNMT